jgi:hypothetical protein
MTLFLKPQIQGAENDTLRKKTGFFQINFCNIGRLPWPDPILLQYSGGHLGKIMIVGKGKSNVNRIQYEKHFSKAIIEQLVKDGYIR